MNHVEAGVMLYGVSMDYGVVVTGPVNLIGWMSQSHMAHDILHVNGRISPQVGFFERLVGFFSAHYSRVRPFIRGHFCYPHSVC